MPEPVRLTVPVDDRYRVLGPEVASKYAELVGGTAADGASLAAALTEAVDKLLAASGSADGIELAFEPGPDGVEISLTCGAQSAVVRHPLLASKE
jgi:hypothetical protein